MCATFPPPGRGPWCGLQCSGRRERGRGGGCCVCVWGGGGGGGGGGGDAWEGADRLHRHVAVLPRAMCTNPESFSTPVFNMQTGYQYLSLYRGPAGDKSQRTVHYAITGSTRFVYAAAVRVFILKVRLPSLPPPPPPPPPPPLFRMSSGCADRR
eukprot:COSAG02_NODE_4376_length_5437_cov_3.803484_4_plen_154_part_00